MAQKLVIIVDNKLSPGQQLAQSIHAMDEFAFKQRKLFDHWKINSNVICCFSANIKEIIPRLDMHDVKYTAFKEPFFNNKITSLAISPLEEKLHNKLFSNLKLSLS